MSRSAQTLVDDHLHEDADDERDGENGRDQAVGEPRIEPREEDRQQLRDDDGDREKGCVEAEVPPLYAVTQPQMEPLLVVWQTRCHGVSISRRSAMLPKRISFDPSGRSQYLRNMAASLRPVASHVVSAIATRIGTMIQAPIVSPSETVTNVRV